MSEERRRHLRSNRDELNMKQKTKVNVDRSVKSKSMTETHKIITPVTVLSRQPYRKSNSHLHVKGQTSNDPPLVQDNIYNCSQHQGEAPTHNRPINVQKQQNNLSPPGPSVRYSKCVQSKRSTSVHQKTLRATSQSCCHKIKQCGLHSIEKRPIGGFQAASCFKDGENHTGSEAAINRINPYINITIHPTTTALSTRNEPTNYELDNSFMKPPVLTCPAATGEKLVQLPEDLNLSFTDGKKCCQATSNLVSGYLGKSHPWFGTECFQDLDSSENTCMEPTRTSSYPKVPPSYLHLELSSDSFHEVNHFGFCPNIKHSPNVWHAKIQKPVPDCIVSKQNGETSPYSDLSLDYPEKQPQIFFPSFDYELLDGPKFASENDIFRTSTNLPGDFVFGQYSGSQFTGLGPFLLSQDDGDVFHERLVDSEEEYGGTSLKKCDAELQRFQSNIETLPETPEKIPPSR
ncbi:uncharacterized protein [Aquarana catesbeiana]|uniref:uncharacterized protein n=1 Tax=Aquarana catesbeiana TaxID=8400 RepID=UPI003CC962F4